MGLFNKKTCIIYWNEDHNEVELGTVEASGKDYYGDVNSYLVDGPRGKVGVTPSNILYIGDRDHMPIGFTRWFNHQACVNVNLGERIDKLEKSHQLMIATLKAVRDILQEGKEDGRSKTCSGVCSRGCSGNHKQSHKNGVQKSR